MATLNPTHSLVDGVTWATSVPILVFLGLSVLDLGPIRTRQTDRRQMCIIA